MSKPNKNGLKIYTYIWLFVFPICFFANKNKFKGGIWFLKTVLCPSLQLSAGVDGMEALAGGCSRRAQNPPEFSFILASIREYTGAAREKSRVGGWVTQSIPLPPSSQPCHILLRAREQEKPLFQGWGDTMEIRDELEKLFYLVEDSSEKPAGKESTGLA